jgi:hypothetical protein
MMRELYVHELDSLSSGFDFSYLAFCVLQTAGEATRKSLNQICKGADDLWKHVGDHQADAEPQEQGENAEKRRENADRAPHDL